MTEVKAKPAPKNIKVCIKSFTKNKGDGVKETTYAVGGYHVDVEDRAHLPAMESTSIKGKKIELSNRKIVPGVVYELPEDVATKYLKKSSDVLEQVYE
ncbi:MAG: hypothetical protein EP323_00440 [Gammaproteobacteria bacterium]|nr:MAG: hypothetical protein EP323_00440 [Gammaproteobacteria bacterium]